jgi:hypothetical protein
MTAHPETEQADLTLRHHVRLRMPQRWLNDGTSLKKTNAQFVSISTCVRYIRHGYPLVESNKNSHHMSDPCIHYAYLPS